MSTDYAAGSAADPTAFVPQVSAETSPGGGHVLQSSEETPGGGSDAYVPESSEETPGDSGQPDAKKKAAGKDALKIPVEKSEAQKAGDISEKDAKELLAMAAKTADPAGVHDKDDK